MNGWTFIAVDPSSNQIIRRSNLAQVSSFLANSSDRFCVVFYGDSEAPLETIRYVGTYCQPTGTCNIFMHMDTVYNRLTYSGEGMTPYQLETILSQNPTLIQTQQLDMPQVPKVVQPSIAQPTVVPQPVHTEEETVEADETTNVVADDESEIGSNSSDDSEEEEAVLEESGSSEESQAESPERMPTKKPTRTIPLPKAPVLEVDAEDLEQSPVPHPKKDERPWKQIEAEVEKRSRSHNRGRRIRQPHRR